MSAEFKYVVFVQTGERTQRLDGKQVLCSSDNLLQNQLIKMVDTCAHMHSENVIVAGGAILSHPTQGRRRIPYSYHHEYLD